jgi:acetyl-CoA carboxylase biotin carboxyl carrier protein
VNLDDVREILALMRENGLAEFEIERDGLKLRLRKDAVTGSMAAAPAFVVAGVTAAPAPATAAPAAAVTAPPGTAVAGVSEVELAVVKSPIVGTFYRSPEPGAASFVDIGTTVKKGQVLCIIEAMKLMNEIDSEFDGDIVNIYVESGQAVQYGERLFAIRTRSV